jgi:hypothetical protein
MGRTVFCYPLKQEEDEYKIIELINKHNTWDGPSYMVGEGIEYVWIQEVKKDHVAAYGCERFIFFENGGGRGDTFKFFQIRGFDLLSGSEVREDDLEEVRKEVEVENARDGPFVGPYPPDVFDAMAKSPEDPGVQLEGLKMIKIVDEEDWLDRFAVDGVGRQTTNISDLAVAALRNFPENQEMQEKALDAIVSLLNCFDEEDADDKTMKIIEAGVCEETIDAMKRFPLVQVIQTHGCYVIDILVQKVPEKFVTMGVCKILVDTMTAFPGCDELQTEACGAISFLATHFCKNDDLIMLARQRIRTAIQSFPGLEDETGRDALEKLAEAEAEVAKTRLTRKRKKIEEEDV